MNLAGGQSMAMYENNEIDITGVGLFDLERVLDPNEPLNQELVIAPPDFSISYIGFNTQMAPFDDVKMRQALNHAIDKQLIAEEVLSKVVLRVAELVGSEILVALDVSVTFTSLETENQLSFPSTTSSVPSLLES